MGGGRGVNRKSGIESGLRNVGGRDWEGGLNRGFA